MLSSLLFALYGESLRLYVQRVAQHALGISIYYHIGRTIRSMYNPNTIHWLCQYIYVFYAKNFFCMNRQYLFRGFWSREAFLTKQRKFFRTSGQDADAQRLSRTFGQDADAQRLSRTSGRDADAQRLSRLRRTHGVPLAYGVPYESKLLFVLLSAPQGKLKRAQPWENSRGWAFLVYREDAFPSILSCWT